MVPTSVVLFGICSPVVVDVEESLVRAGIDLAAGVRNVDAEPWLQAADRLVELTDVGPDLLAQAFLIPLFAPGNRYLAATAAHEAGFTRATTLIDPTAIVPRRWRVGAGTYVNAGCTIGAASEFGEFVFVNRSASIGHHSRLDDFASIGPGATLAGNVRIGKGACVGAGAIVLPEVAVGSNAVIAAGAVVGHDVPDHTLVAGHPARVVKTGIRGFRDRSVA